MEGGTGTCAAPYLSATGIHTTGRDKKVWAVMRKAMFFKGNLYHTAAHTSHLPAVVRTEKRTALTFSWVDGTIKVP